MLLSLQNVWHCGLVVPAEADCKHSALIYPCWQLAQLLKLVNKSRNLIRGEMSYSPILAALTWISRKTYKFAQTTHLSYTLYPSTSIYEKDQLSLGKYVWQRNFRFNGLKERRSAIRDSCWRAPKKKKRPPPKRKWVGQEKSLRGALRNWIMKDARFGDQGNVVPRAQ